ncbi:phosphoglycerate mutase-like protein [Hyaloscypha variabilis F]|uniref:Phosphoglycerate mutase-like protein n=1 Tax=Hyaloscypha variabilis (strain UAMH 11265 / GT02V1 / F) TaxID=1149755 RepID=A0A2J6RDJ7_HYAVF|nr:phosphoglycerate mutase-like protein [Hyaloscypha variabilis F]
MVQLQGQLAGIVLVQWFLQLGSAAQIPLLPKSHTEGYKFDPLLHLPGISPYFDAIGSGLSHAAPKHCEVTAASYLVRHAAIYANDDDYETFIEPLIKKLNSTYTSTLYNKKRKGWNGPLSFFDKWEDPIDDPHNQLEQITPQGIKDSKKVGKHLLSRYPKLVRTTKRVYADKKARTKDTAAAFVKVFPQKIEVVEINLNRSSFHAQDPHKACKAFSKKPGNDELGVFTSHYTIPIIERLQGFSPVKLEETDIVGLQQLCGYESAIRGKKSDICDVFTDSEWMAYEYAWDLKYSHMVGHGNPLSPYLGFPWLKTTSELMSKFHAPQHTDDEIPDDDGQRFFLAFTHREVPPFIATALGLFNSSNAYAEEFPTDRINWSRSWKMAELIPFLGHVGIEKLTCNAVSKDPKDTREYIRVIANSAPRPIPKCQDGPGASCGFDEFTRIVRTGMEVYGDFDGVCGNDEEKEDEGEL